MNRRIPADTTNVKGRPRTNDTDFYLRDSSSDLQNKDDYQVDGRKDDQGSWPSGDDLGEEQVVPLVVLTDNISQSSDRLVFLFKISS